MDIKITGGYTSGLNVYFEDKLIFYSKNKNTWFSGNYVSIYDVDNNLLIKTKETGLIGTTYNLLFLNEDFIEPFRIEKPHLSNATKLILSDTLTTISFIPNKISISSSFAKIMIDGKEVCKLKIFLSLERHFEFSLKEHDPLINYVIFLILITTTCYDYD